MQGAMKNRDFRLMSRFISETIQDTGRVIMKGDYEIVSKLLNGVSFNDLE